MEIAKFEALIRRMEAQADKSHCRFRLRVIGLVALGYVLTFLILLGIGLFLVAAVAGRAIFACIALARIGGHFAVGTWRGFWVKAGDSTAASLPDDLMAPLVQLVDQVAADLGAPKVHKVWVTCQWNAYAYMRPSLGPFGPFKNEVTIGLPLLAVLTEEEVRSIVAHEIGHIHRGHSRFGLRVLQISRAWDQAISEMKKNKVRGGLVIKLFEWYAPRLRAAQHVLSRISEREANKAQTELAGVQTHVQSRVDGAILGVTFHESFQEVLKESFHEEEIPQDILVRLCSAMRRPLIRETMLERLELALAEPYDPFASHPPISQMLREMGVEPSLQNVLTRVELPGPDRQYAGEALFGSAWHAFMLEASRAWVDRNRRAWQVDRAARAAKREKLEELLASVKDREPSDEERIDLAIGLHGAGEFDEAARWLEPVKDANERAKFTQGLLLRQRKDPAWVACMEAAATDPGLMPTAAQILIDHYSSAGARADVQRLYKAMHDRKAYETRVRESRLKLDGDWKCAAAHWTSDGMTALLAELEKMRFVKRAYLVQRTNGEACFDHYCLVAEFGHGATPTNIVQQLKKLQYAGKCYLFAVPKVPHPIASVDGALIFDRKRGVPAFLNRAA